MSICQHTRPSACGAHPAIRPLQPQLGHLLMYQLQLMMCVRELIFERIHTALEFGCSRVSHKVMHKYGCALCSRQQIDRLACSLPPCKLVGRGLQHAHFFQNSLETMHFRLVLRKPRNLNQKPEKEHRHPDWDRDREDDRPHKHQGIRRWTELPQTLLC